jgi:hypothetical protein
MIPHDDRLPPAVSLGRSTLVSALPWCVQVHTRLTRVANGRSPASARGRRCPRRAVVRVPTSGSSGYSAQSRSGSCHADRRDRPSTEQDCENGQPRLCRPSRRTCDLQHEVWAVQPLLPTKQSHSNRSADRLSHCLLHGLMPPLGLCPPGFEWRATSGTTSSLVAVCSAGLAGTGAGRNGRAG